MTTMQLELTSPSGQRLDALVVPDQGLDAWDFVESGLYLYEGEMEIIPPIPTIEEVRRKVTRGLEQIARGEFAEGTPEEVFDRALQESFARTARDDTSS